MKVFEIDDIIEPQKFEKKVNDTNELPNFENYFDII